jgi:hypothetical protein
VNLLTHFLVFLDNYHANRNPHIPGQRLRVHVPKGTFPGETFKVTVPVPKPAPGEEDEGVDHNKFPREFQDELDIYAREFDDFCRHEGEYRHAKDEDETKYAIHLEKRKKYDRVVREFPKNLLTPIDVEYMKKLVRRARQNKHKRIKTAATRRPSMESAPTGGSDNDDKQEAGGDSDEDEAAAPPEPSAPPTPEEPSPPTHRIVNIPQRGVVFDERTFHGRDFIHIKE